MTVQESKLPFSGYLFWDVSPKDLDLDKYPTYFVERVLDCGSWNDWIAIRNYYGMEKITKVALDLRSLERKSLAFIATVTGIPENKFRCYKQLHSPNVHWYF
ncbi:hypothetical protein FACS189430_07720 [Bacteroidia bacterium]|nr:hypothetical protein FACS189430_07720 [Bacteroidia bacterium]